MTVRDRFINKVKIPFPIHSRNCWTWTGAIGKGGYGNFYDGSKYVNAHRYSYMLFIGTPPKDSVVMHTCDVCSCVNPKHLKIGTQKDNLQDMYSKGRNRGLETYEQQRGEKHYMHKKIDNE